MENDSICVIDLKAFYASCECVERGLDPFTTPLAVTDTTRKESTIVLSVSPYLKSLGVPSRCRRKDLPIINGMIYALPQMEKYVKKSAQIVSIFLDFVGIDDLHIYSIDESFLNLGPYLKLYKCTPKELCLRILKKIKDETGLTATCGIGPNMFLAKVADDKDAKTAKDFLAEWTYDDVPSKLWPITPLNELWGISEGYLKKLNQLGIYKVYDLAHYNKNLLMAKFGVLGEELYEHANGRDDAKIRDKYVPINKGLSLGQVLMRDYTKEEARLIISEMCDELAIRLRKTKLECNTVGLYLRYSLTCGGEGFGKNCSLMRPSNLNSELKQTLLYLYDSNALHKPIRQIGISFTNLSKPSYEQLSLFKNLKADDDERNLYVALDQIMEKYGKNSVLKGTSLTKESTIKERHNQIGGHRK
ncbi:MAG: hypothetical protein WCR97_02500 [Bacilli bacterium]